MTPPHEGIPKGVPMNTGWALGPRVGHGRQSKRIQSYDGMGTTV